MTKNIISLVADLTDAEALALAQFLKRIGFSDLREKSVDDAEAYLMRDGCDKLVKALNEHGYSPR